MTYSQLAMVAALRSTWEAYIHELDVSQCATVDAKMATQDQAAAYFVKSKYHEARAEGLLIAFELQKRMCEIHKCSRLVAEAACG